MPSTQIFLLGGNPLPIRVAAEALSPKVLILVATPQTKDLVSDPESSAHQNLIPDLTLRTVQLPNHHDRGKLEDGLNLLLDDLKLQQQPIGLNYPGGIQDHGNQSLVVGSTAGTADPRTLMHSCSFTAAIWMGSRTWC